MSWKQKMESSAGVERAQAVMDVAEQNEWSDIPRVIERLEDDDETVRLMAVGTLREMTGREFGYKAYAPEHERRKSAERWRNWWEAEGKRGRKAVAAEPGEKP